MIVAIKKSKIHVKKCNISLDLIKIERLIDHQLRTGRIRIKSLLEGFWHGIRGN